MVKAPDFVDQPGLAALLADPIVTMMMKADRVDERQLTAVVEAARRRVIDRSAASDSLSTTARRPTAYRAGVGIMLLNPRGEVFVGHRRGVTDQAWQMPQGGIDPGEAPRHAAFREMKEEIGTDRAELLAESNDWLTYDLPEHLQLGGRHGSWRGQRQKWFAMGFTGRDEDINVNTEAAEFSEWRWVAVELLPLLIVDFKRELYRRVIEEFRVTLPFLRRPLRPRRRV